MHFGKPYPWDYHRSADAKTILKSAYDAVSVTGSIDEKYSSCCSLRRGRGQRKLREL